MRKIIIVLIAISSYHAFSQDAKPKYDKELAQKLGADEYGMKRYVLAILKTGPTPLDNAKAGELFRGHLDNINKLVEEGKVVVVGPLDENPQQYRGIFIFNVKSVDEAKALLVNDPIISQNIMTADYFSWYGSAALPEYLPIHEKIELKRH